MYSIQAENVIKQYKNGIQALSGLTLSVKSGEIYSLLGPNGAGKSTLIRILTTYLSPSSGKITMLGRNLCQEAAAIRSQIACVAQQVSIDTHLSLEENMMFQSRLYRIPKVDAKARMEKLIKDFELNQYRKYPVSSYSGGVKRRLDVALCMMSNPQILFLDEPTVGMDVQSRIAMWSMVKKIRDDFGTTIFLTTHYLEEADNLSNNICIIKDGKEVTQGTPFELRALLRKDIVKVTFLTKEDAKRFSLLLQESLPSKRLVVRDAEAIVNTNEPRVDMENMVATLLKSHIPFHGIEIVQPSLEDVFLRLTEGDTEKCS